MDAQLSALNVAVTAFGDDSAVAEDQRSQASTVSTWPPRSVHDEPFNFSSLVVAFLFARTLVSERAGPDGDSRMFWVSHLEVISLSHREPVGDVPGQASFVTEDDVFRRDVGAHSRAGVSRVRISQFADGEIVSWRGRCVRACELCSRCELSAVVQGHRPVPSENGSRPTAGDSELIEDVSLDSFACNYEDHAVTRR